MQTQHDTAAVRNTKELGSTVKTTALAIPRPNEITIPTELNLTLVKFLFFGKTSVQKLSIIKNSKMTTLIPARQPRQKC